MNEVDELPLLRPPLLGKEVMGSYPDKPALISPDPSLYEPEFSGFTFWEIAPVERVVIFQEPDPITEPLVSQDISVDSEGYLKETLRWVVWYCCQEKTKKNTHRLQARKLGKQLLLDRGYEGEAPPRKAYRCGTIMMRATKEEAKSFEDHWDKTDLTWCCWYAAFGDIKNDRLSASAWNTGCNLLSSLDHVRRQKRKTVLKIRFSVVENEAEKNAFNRVVNEVSRRLRSLEGSVRKNFWASQLETVPALAITKPEFEAKWAERNFKKIGAGESLFVLGASI